MHDPYQSDRALLRVPAGGRARADEWALVLTSQNIPVRVLHTPDGWALELPSADLPSAEATLASYEREREETALARVAAKREQESFTPQGPRWAGVPIGFALLATFAYTGNRVDGNVLFAQGSALGERILEGEWWRCVTALCLHANLEHVLSNVLAIAFFMGLVCRMLGFGFGFALILASGALGNALNAIAQPPNHNTVGASTAIFGAIGLLSGLAVVRQYRSDLHGRRSWVPLGAGLALLAMLGTGGEHVDLEAHFFGLLAGVVLGAAVALRLKQAPPTNLQWLFGSTSVATLLACWSLALHSWSHLRIATLVSMLLFFSYAVEDSKISHVDSAPHNPVIEDTNLADPTVISYEGMYYLYATGDMRGFDVYTSRDLLHWVRERRVLQLDSKNVWAPDVYRDAKTGKFYLYYAANFRVGVAVAEHPLGPFEDLGILIEGAIDAHLFRDDDGALYLYYEAIAPMKALRRFSLPTGRIVVQPMESPLRLDGEPRTVLEPEADWERGLVAIVEGPWMLKRGTKYYLMYSGNVALTEDYAIGYATSESPLGPFVKYSGNPIVKKKPGIIGPGHHSLIEGRDGELWMVYHQKVNRTWSFDRRICIDRLTFTESGALQVIPSAMREKH